MRLVWRRPEPDGQPVLWQHAALIIATLFLNFHFFVYESGLWMRVPLLPAAAVLFMIALLMAGLFFVGPALVCQTHQLDIVGAVTRSFGTIPGLATRIVLLWFLVTWISLVLVGPVFFLASSFTGIASLTLLVPCLLIFLGVTAAGSLPDCAALAAFSLKLCTALLIVVLIRVRRELPYAVYGYRLPDEASNPAELWNLVPSLVFYIGAPILLACSLARRMEDRKAVWKTAGAGLVLPLFGALLIVGIGNVAVFRSAWYRPSLEPNVAMGLWSGTVQAGRLAAGLLATLTLLGMLRFATRASFEVLPRRLRIVSLVFLVGLVTWSFDRDIMFSTRTYTDPPVVVLAMIAAVLTADALVHKASQSAPRVDMVALLSLLVGAAAMEFSRHVDPSYGGRPLVLVGYAATFGACFAGRFVQRYLARRFPR